MPLAALWILCPAGASVPVYERAEAKKSERSQALNKQRTTEGGWP